MKLKSKTNIIVSCWNAIEHTKVTLSSLFGTVHHPYFLTIVDNGSIDGTSKYLKKLIAPDQCEKLIVIKNIKNKGAGHAINQGQKISLKYGLKYTCLCNNDLFFQNNWLQLLEDCMENNNKIGIAGTLRPAIDTVHHTKSLTTKYIVDCASKNKTIQEELELFQDGYDFETTCRMIVKKNGGGILFLRCPPNAVVTCCAIVRNSTSKNIGLFSDPQFNVYGSEDIDLSWRLQEAGFSCVILKDVYVHHFRHRSISSSNLDREKYLLENNIKFFKKWKRTIFLFLYRQKNLGIDIESKLENENDPEYFFLRRIEDKTEFMLKYKKWQKLL